jgi:hypothetical protein
MGQVECQLCKLVKDSSLDFYWCGGKRQPHCKECQKMYVAEWKRGAKIREEASKKRFEERKHAT